jgi:hypothetical protein
MKPSLRLVLVGGTALVSCAIADFASAQPMPPQPPAAPLAATSPPAPGVPAYDLQQLPETRGTLLRFTLTARGDLDGFLLADGTQVHLPPHLSALLAVVVRPGDQVAVRGYRSPTAPLVLAAAVTDSTTNQTVVDQGPAAPGFGPPPPPPPGVPTPGAQQTSVSGRVETPLYGPAGDLNGAVLADGTIVRLPPPTAYQSASLLATRQTIVVQGWALNTPFGRVVDAQAIGPTSEQMTSVTQPLAPGAPIAPVGASQPTPAQP